MDRILRERPSKVYVLDFTLKFEHMKTLQQETDLVRVSLYSINNFDVSPIAVEFGGGGHKEAAGFKCSKIEYIDICSDWEIVFVK